MKALEGRPLADAILREARALSRRAGRAPRLAVVAAAGGAGESYVKAQRKAAAAAGVELQVHRLSPGPRAKTLGLLADLAAGVDAVLVETPLPKGLSAADVAAVVPAAKDVEGLSEAAFGRLFLAKSWDEARGLTAPATAAAIARLALAARVPLGGKRAVVVGRSSVVGRPAAHLLSCLDLTVTLAHSKSRGLAALCREADVLVAAAGSPRMIKASWVKRGALVIDAGTTLVKGRLLGDVDPGAAARASKMTPVPGGVGPVTTAVTMLQAARLAASR